MPEVLLLTPPFTQLNTPYPATAYLQGFLRTQGVACSQADLGIDTILALFSREGLSRVFAALEESEGEVSENSFRIYQLRDQYIATVEPVIRFLQHKNPTLAHRINSRTYLPEAGRFQGLEDLSWAFGVMSIADKARHLATLYLEDLADLIKEAVDPHFGFSRYAERLGRTATHFDELEQALRAPDSVVSEILLEALGAGLAKGIPRLVCLSVPFPGNLFAALKIGQYLKRHHPGVAVALGGGYANTELRSLREPRLFDYVDFVCLDDGEAPLLCLLDHLRGLRPRDQLKRTFCRTEAGVRFMVGAKEKDVPQREVGTPDYEGLRLDRYLSVLDLLNPMHSLWSNGRWNKLTLAHGCYWGKCSFCDVSLDYIGRYEPVDAVMLVDRMEAMIAQTGEDGFHFVDEAAPPALMRDLAIEILRRKLTVSWWTNIRFEKRFTPDLCRLLAASGCIAVSGGLEVASDRLLALMQKGVTVALVARVAEAFTDAGIMVHAYLMYGFPTQTAQETIDSLEMVRQMFSLGLIQSGFWHQFAMTAHSPVGLNPAAYGVVRVGPDFGGFADNDLFHEDPSGAQHEQFSEGLRNSLLHYMQGTGFDEPLGFWFDFPVPETTVSPDYLAEALADAPDPWEEAWGKGHNRVLWLGGLPEREEVDGKTILTFALPQEDWSVQVSEALADWLSLWLPGLQPSGEIVTAARFRKAWEEAGFAPWEHPQVQMFWEQMREKGFLVV